MSAEADVKLNDFKNIFSLNGKVAVVTGGSRGLGLHAASGYASPQSSWQYTVVQLELTNSYQPPPSRLLQNLHHLPQSQSLHGSLRRSQQPEQKARPLRPSHLHPRRHCQTRRSRPSSQGSGETYGSCRHLAGECGRDVGGAVRQASR